MLHPHTVVIAFTAFIFFYSVEAIAIRNDLTSQFFSSVVPSSTINIVTATLTSTVVICPTTSDIGFYSASQEPFSTSSTLPDLARSSSVNVLQSLTSTSGSPPFAFSLSTLNYSLYVSQESFTTDSLAQTKPTSRASESSHFTSSIERIAGSSSQTAKLSTISSTGNTAAGTPYVSVPSSTKISENNATTIISSWSKKASATSISSSSTIISISSSTTTFTTVSSTAPTATSPSSSGYCKNSPTSRRCWGNYSIDTDWYSTVPDTGVTREYWLSVENTTLAPDGYERHTLTFNGTIPGPAIIADWGDNMIIHVTNNLEHNGTSIHWHGLRQLGSSEYDGVPGVTQCPIAPGDTMTYRFRATQYGSTWYHSHFSLQYAEGLFGPMILNGPATADYDEDLGLLFLSDWSHTSAFSLWDIAKSGLPPTLENGLVNGTNTFDCSNTTDVHCIGGGKKLETIFEAGKKYRYRLINVAIEGHFEFSIDGHNFTVIANDLVPIVPYQTDRIVIGEGQRYDVIVEANAEPGDYWLRAGWQTACSSIHNAADITSIVRYDASSTADPVTTGITVSDNCADEALINLVPHLAMNVGNFSEVTQETLGFVFQDAFLWTINTSSLYMNWSDPTTLRVLSDLETFPKEYNVVSVEKNNPVATDEWTVYVIQDKSGIGLSHPIHLHGHDFWVIGQSAGTFDLATSELNLINPPRRDVASLPANGYLAIAFKKDNPGAWIMHCHIAWHASQGLGLQFVESMDEISMKLEDKIAFEDTCLRWDAYTPTEVYLQDDSGV